MSPKLLTQSLTSMLLLWIPPNNSICVIGYTVSFINVTEGNEPEVYNTTTNTTSMTVSDLTKGAAYSFTVAGIDTGGRLRESSDLAELMIFDGEWWHRK